MKTQTKAKRPIGVDLFAGAGGLSLGFEQAGFDVLAAIEFDPIHAAVHEFNFPNCATICRSVADVDGAYVRFHSKIEDRDIDVVFGGAPCQGFSMIGKRALDDPRNQLVYHFVRLVSQLKPKYFVFENVRGLTVGEHKNFLEEIIEEFSDAGYKVLKDYKVLNAANFGVPQNRHRLFLMGSRRDCPLPAYPCVTHQFPGKSLDLGFLDTSPTVWDAISDLPEAGDFEELLERDWILTKFGTPSTYAKTLRQTPNSRGQEALTSSMRTIHTALSQGRFQATSNGDIEPVSRFLKLDPLGVCNTLRAGTASDRGAFTSPRPIHPYSPRCITVREAARLHSYPDRFRFHVTKWHGFRQVGNSVPPLLGMAVAGQIVEALEIEVSAPGIHEGGDVRLLEMNMSEAARHYEVPVTVIPQRIRKAQSEAVYA